jgi:hypothetical protein
MNHAQNINRGVDDVHLILKVIDIAIFLVVTSSNMLPPYMNISR